MESAHVFALANPGSESALKLEAAGLGWRPGYQRRGFATFQADRPFTLDDLSADIAMARRLCLSLGKSATHEAALALVPAGALVHEARFEDRRMKGLPGPTAPRVGDLIGTVVELGPAEYWTGLHLHTPLQSPDPAGDGGLEMPANSPSRAWLKLEEAVRFFGLSFTPEDIVVELGCAPGGVVLALLDRGVSVVGVDPAKMAEVIAGRTIPQRAAAPRDSAWFYHCRKPAALASRRDVAGATWFMSDMNQSPDVVLAELARFCKMAPTIRGALLTLKLTDFSQVEEKDRWFAALREMGFGRIRLQQLAVHHRELALLAVR